MRPLRIAASQVSLGLEIDRKQGQVDVLDTIATDSFFSTGFTSSILLALPPHFSCITNGSILESKDEPFWLTVVLVLMSFYILHPHPHHISLVQVK